MPLETRTQRLSRVRLRLALGQNPRRPPDELAARVFPRKFRGGRPQSPREPPEKRGSQDLFASWSRRGTTLDSQTRRKGKGISSTALLLAQATSGTRKHAFTFRQPTRTGGRRGAWGRCRRPDAGSAASAPQTATVTKTCRPACPPRPGAPLDTRGFAPSRAFLSFSLVRLCGCLSACASVCRSPDKSSFHISSSLAVASYRRN